MCKITYKCSQLEPRNILKFQYVQLFEQRTSMFIIFRITYVYNTFILANVKLTESALRCRTPQHSAITEV